MTDTLEAVATLVVKTAQNISLTVHLDDQGVFGERVSHKVNQTQLQGRRKQQVYTPDHT